jgi:hypothetical protein
VAFRFDTSGIPALRLQCFAKLVVQCLIYQRTTRAGRMGFRFRENTVLACRYTSLKRRSCLFEVCKVCQER